MFGAFKSWAMKQSKSPPKRQRDPSDQLRTKSVLISKLPSSCNLGDDENMTTYGELLLCPLCQELYTHPVLLPCQHSLCYGCARAQLLSSENVDAVRAAASSSVVESPKSVDTSAITMSPLFSPSRFRNVSSMRGADFSCIPLSDTTVLSDFGLRTESESSFVLSTNDCLHFQYNGPEATTPTTSSLISPTCKPQNTPAAKPAPPVSSKTPLRRSNSTSSVSRPISAKCRSQQIYGTLKRSKVKSLFCPNCREMVELGKNGMSGLFRNFALESIVERFRSKAKAAVAIRCGYCKPPASDATRSCLDCKDLQGHQKQIMKPALSYCNECFKTVHVWGTKKARHNFIGPTNNFSRPKVLLCPDHSNEVNMYCNKCKKSVCRLCKTGGGGHVNHAITSAKIACREGKERLCADLEKLRKKKEEWGGKIRELEQAFTELERRDAETRDMIHTSLDGIYRALEAKRSELLAKSESRFRNNEQCIKQELQCHHQLLMAASISNFAEEVLKESDPIFFLQTSRMVELKLKEVLNNMNELEGMEINLPSHSLSLDLQSVKAELEKVDFLDPQDKAFIGSRSRADDIQREDFQLMVVNHDSSVTTESSGKVVHIPKVHWEPCVLRGTAAFTYGDHVWQVCVTSFGARRVLVGVCNLSADEKLHGSIARGRSGAFLAVLPGAIFMYDGDLPFTSGNELEGISARSTCSIGKHDFVVRIYLSFEQDEAIARFYEVCQNDELRELFQKTFKCNGPAHPVVVVNGEAIVRLV